MRVQRADGTMCVCYKLKHKLMSGDKKIDLHVYTAKCLATVTVKSLTFLQKKEQSRKFFYIANTELMTATHLIMVQLY